MRISLLKGKLLYEYYFQSEALYNAQKGGISKEQIYSDMTAGTNMLFCYNAASAFPIKDQEREEISKLNF